MNITSKTDWPPLPLDGWRDTLVSAGVRTPPLLRGDWSPGSGYRLGMELAARDDATAVFAANDQMALGVLRAFHERGIAVPEQRSVVGFDDIPEAEFFQPGLTTVRQDFDAVGRKGLGLLLNLMENANSRRRHVSLIKPHFIERSSTARAAGRRRRATSKAAVLR